MMKLGGDHDDQYILSSGRVVDCNCGILGISPSADNIFGGYDEHVATADAQYYTKEEKLEIADFAISKWDQFKEKVNATTRQGKDWGA